MLRPQVSIDGEKTKQRLANAPIIGKAYAKLYWVAIGGEGSLVDYDRSNDDGGALFFYAAHMDIGPFAVVHLGFNCKNQIWAPFLYGQVIIFLA